MKRLISLSLFLALLLVGCSNTPATNNNTTPDGNGYPNGYPVRPPTPTPYLPSMYPAADATPDGTVLAFDRPFNEGETVLTGVGLPGLSISIQNITTMGEELAVGVIDKNGRFSVTVAPLPASVRIGLTADIQEGMKIAPGDNPISIPRVGYFFDSFVIFADNN